MDIISATETRAIDLENRKQQQQKIAATKLMQNVYVKKKVTFVIEL